jgi:hypothetical protein
VRHRFATHAATRVARLLMGVMKRAKPSPLGAIKAPVYTPLCSPCLRLLRSLVAPFSPVILAWLDAIPRLSTPSFFCFSVQTICVDCRSTPTHCALVPFDFARPLFHLNHAHFADPLTRLTSSKRPARLARRLKDITTRHPTPPTSSSSYTLDIVNIICTADYQSSLAPS